MSEKAKGTSIEKILKEFGKSDLDEQLKLYRQIKEYLHNKLEERQAQLEQKAIEIQDAKEKL